MKTDIVIIGGGAAGMLAAGTAAEAGKRVVLVEQNERLGKKLYITYTHNRKTIAFVEVECY